MAKRKPIAFTFMEGTMPINRDEYVPWDVFEKTMCNKNIFLAPSQMGTDVIFMTKQNIIHHSAGANVWFTDEFMLKDPEGLFSLYLSLLDECKTK